MKSRRRWVFVLVTVAVCMQLTALLIGVSVINSVRPAGIIIHHAAIPPRHDGRPIDARLIDEFHARRGFNVFYWGRFYHIGYHYIILQDGTVQTGRPEHCRGAHAEGHNSEIGICLIGDFSTADNPTGERGVMEPTEPQMQALTRLCRELGDRYNLPLESIRRHSDVNPNTECPGDRFPFEEFIRRLKKRHNGNEFE